MIKLKSVLPLACGILASLPAFNQPTQAAPKQSQFHHVLILSVDGLHSADLQDPALKPYLKNIDHLRSEGVTYPNAYTTSPSDSFPGTLSYLTGAGPKTVGVYYDDTYDRNLTPSEPLCQA